MRTLILSILFLFLFSPSVFSSEEMQSLQVNPTKKCKMNTVQKKYYLNLCPTGWVMIGGTPIQGSNTLQVLCAEMEIVCE